MLLIQCPYCGERPEIEFSYGGQAHLARPEHPADLSDDEWWTHSAGCRQWFVVSRDTRTHEILGSAEPGHSAARTR